MTCSSRGASTCHEAPLDEHVMKHLLTMTCWSGSVSWHVRQEVIHEMYVRKWFMTCSSRGAS